MTTAASTGFAIAKLIGPGGRTLWLDGNQKITAGNGSFLHPAPNAFSLPQIKTCPGSTPTCRETCYVHNLEEHQPNLHKCYVENLHNIKLIVEHRLNFTGWARHLGKWITKNAAGGFRWHVSGDVFSKKYAEWIGAVCDRSPDVQHWIYTRSFSMLEPLVFDTPNLTVNISADADNYLEAKDMAAEHDLKLCYLTTDGTVPDDLDPGDVIFPDYPLRGIGKKPHDYRDGSPFWNALTGDQKRMVCPTDAYGKSAAVRCGPCDRCIK